MNIITRKLAQPALIATVIACALLQPLASAQARDYGSNRFAVYGKVIRAVPIYREVHIREPIEQCRIKEERYLIQESQDSHAKHQHNSNRHYRDSHTNRGSADTLVGTVIGGVIGNQLGRNGSRGARAGATIAGAIIGSAVTNKTSGNHNHNIDWDSDHKYSGKSHQGHRRFNNRHNYKHRPARQTYHGSRAVEHCETVIKTRVEKRIEGYNVTYVYQGRKSQTRTRRDPGSRIELTAQVAPVRGQ